MVGARTEIPGEVSVMKERMVLIVGAFALLTTACGSPSRDPLAAPLGGDASADAPLDAGPLDASDGATSDEGGPLGPPCTDDPQCDDSCAGEHVCSHSPPTGRAAGGATTHPGATLLDDHGGPP